MANEIYHQARTLLSQARMPAGTNPLDSQALRSFVQIRFAADAGLNSLLESAVGYSPSIYYAAIADTRRPVMLHNDPGEIGQVKAPAPPFDDLLHAGLLRQLRVIYGPSKVYEVVLPLEIGDKPFGDVRVGVSTLSLHANQRLGEPSSWAVTLTFSRLALLHEVVEQTPIPCGVQTSSPKKHLTLEIPRMQPSLAQQPIGVKASAGRWWCHLREMGAPSRSHSRESGNPLREPSEMRGPRTVFPLSRE